MSSYKYTIKDFHAIKNAQITLDGITVLSGINGCGKSTLSRWLYYIVNGTVDYDKILIEDYKSNIIGALNRINFALHDINRFYRHNNRSDDFSIIIKTQNVINQLAHLNCKSPDDIKNANDLFLQIIHSIGNFLVNEKLVDLPKARVERFFSFLGIDFTENNLNNAVDKFIDVNFHWMTSLTARLFTDLNNRPRKLFYDHISSKYNIDEVPKFLQLNEDGVDVIEEHISNIYNLDQVIYVDTPMSVTIENSDNSFWNGLRELIMKNKKNNSLEAKKLLMRIKLLLQGETILTDDDDFLEDKTLRYVSFDKKINIDLKEAATGFKTFSYLQRLLY